MKITPLLMASTEPQIFYQLILSYSCYYPDIISEEIKVTYFLGRVYILNAS